MPQVNVGIDLLNTPDHFEPLPAAWYKAQVVGAEVKKKEGGEFPYIEWKFKILGAQRESEVYHITTLKPPKAGYPSGVKAVLTASKTPFSGNSFNTEDALGRYLMVNLTIEEYEGVAWNKVGAVKESKD